MDQFFKTANSSFLMTQSVIVNPAQVLQQTLQQHNTVDLTFLPARTLAQQNKIREEISNLLAGISSNEKQQFINTLLCSLMLTKQSQIIIIAASYNMKLTPVIIKNLLTLLHNIESSA